LGLFDAALHLVNDGTLTLRLAEDGRTGAHSTIRCEIAHPSARVKTDALEEALALKSTDKNMPDAAKFPVQHQAAKAWRAVRALQGQHGFMLPEQGGFMIWFTLTMGRPAASVTLRPRTFELAGNAAEAPAPAAETAENAAARANRRMHTECLTCNLGEVVELGTESMRVFCAKSPKGASVKVKFEDVDIATEYSAEITWTKKISGRKHDVGLKLVGLSAAEQQRLLRLAIQHRRSGAPIAETA
jgi:hypothetical protein